MFLNCTSPDIVRNQNSGVVNYMNTLHTKSGFPEEIDLIISGSRSHEETIQKLSENPEHLINFFGIISNRHNQWYLKNSIDFDTTFKKINILRSENAFNQNQIIKILEILKHIYPLVEPKTNQEISSFMHQMVLSQSDESKLEILSRDFDVNFEQGCHSVRILRLPLDKAVELIFNKFEAAKTIENFSILEKSLPINMLPSILGKIMRADINWFLENLTNFNYIFYFQFDSRNIIDFFKLICDHSLSNSTNLNTFLKTISKSYSFNSFGSGCRSEALNRNDIKHVIEISKIINFFPSILLKGLFNQFFKNIMNEHFHVISILGSTGDLSLTIESTKVNLENLRWYIQNLSEVYVNKDIKICFLPNYQWKKSEVRRFIQEHGQDQRMTLDIVDWRNYGDGGDGEEDRMSLLDN